MGHKRPETILKHKQDILRLKEAFFYMTKAETIIQLLKLVGGVIIVYLLWEILQK